MSIDILFFIFKKKKKTSHETLDFEVERQMKIFQTYTLLATYHSEWIYLSIYLSIRLRSGSGPQKAHISLIKGEKNPNFFFGQYIGFLVLMQKNPISAKKKPWFYSSTWHLTSGTAIDGHWTLCLIISTYQQQQNQIKSDFAGPQMIGFL